MITVVCMICRHVWDEAVVLGKCKCPKCGSDQIHVALPEEVAR